MLVKCNDREGEYGTIQNLTLNAIYDVIAFETEHLRIPANDGWPYLYSSDLFVVVDDTIPDDWEISVDVYCGLYYGPPQFGVPGFWESVFESDADAINAYLERQHTHSTAARNPQSPGSTTWLKLPLR